MHSTLEIVFPSLDKLKSKMFTCDVLHAENVALAMVMSQMILGHHLSASILGVFLLMTKFFFPTDNSNDGENDWYQRWENNGWRLVSDKVICFFPF